MSKIPDAWEDEWSNVADKSSDNPSNESSGEAKKVTGKATKAQRRAQQAEFNRQLWAEAEGPKETNYFLESRNVVPLRSEFKPPPILLSRKGPIVVSAPRAPAGDLSELSLDNGESSDDEDEAKTRELSLAERQAQAAKEREERRRKYDERRLELFGPAATTAAPANSNLASALNNRSGTSTPASLTPPGSRSATPNRGGGGRGKGGRGRGGGGAATATSSNTARTQSRTSQQQTRERELYDPSYVQRPDSGFGLRRENGGAFATPNPRSSSSDIVQPIRAPKGPDGSGRGGFGFANARVS